MDIQEARKKIDTIDALLAQNYKKRLEIVADIAKYKDEHQMPLIDEVRDTDIIASIQMIALMKNYVLILKLICLLLFETMNIYVNICISIYFLSVCQGAGKTTVGKALSKELNCDFYDLDLTIQEKNR